MKQQTNSLFLVCPLNFVFNITTFFRHTTVLPITQPPFYNDTQFYHLPPVYVGIYPFLISFPISGRRLQKSATPTGRGG